MPTLTWLTREEDLKAAGHAPYRLLEPVETFGDPSTENMLIQGDNLEALKALLPYYAGKVKCIYIDPPFNTGQAFEHYDDNLENTIWLSILYPRLELLRELLSEDGAIFIHIDDEQLSYLTVIADEIFGRSNRINTITFKQGSATGHKSINQKLVTTTNFIISYSKSKDKWNPNKQYTSKPRDLRYNQFIVNFDAPYAAWQTIPLSQAFAKSVKIATKVVKKQLGDQYESMIYEFVIQNAERVIRTARPDYEKVGNLVKLAIDESKTDKDNVLLFKRNDDPDMYFKNGERILFYKDKLKVVDGVVVSGEPLTNLWDDILSNNLHNEGGVKFPKGKKPEFLLKRIIELQTQKGDIVLDSFLGSGTTAAVAGPVTKTV